MFKNFLTILGALVFCLYIAGIIIPGVKFYLYFGKDVDCLCIKGADCTCSKNVDE